MVRWGRLFAASFFALFWATVLLPLFSSESLSQPVENITIQSKLSDKFARILFQMYEVETFDVSLNNKTITINFGKPISASFNRLLVTLEEYVEKATIGKNQDAIILEMKGRDFEVRKFKSRNYAGIDILLPDKKKVVAQLQKKPSKAGTPIAKTIRKINPPKLKPLSVIKTLRRGEYGPPLPPVALTLYKIPKLKPKLFLTVNTGAGVGPLSAEDYERKLENAFSFPPIPPEPGDSWKGKKAITWDDSSEEKALLALEAKPEPKPDPELEPEIIAEPEPEPEAEQQLAEADQISENFDFTATVTKTNGGINIHFPWKTRTASALYKRGGVLWAVFNHHKTIDLSKIIESDYILSAEQIFHKDYTILKMKVKHKKGKLPNITTVKDDFNWVIEIKEGEQKLVPVSAKIDLDTTGVISKALIHIKDRAIPLKILDPIIGDKIIITPLYRGKMGISPKRTFIDFDVLDSIQGVVITLKSDKTFVSPRTNNLIISKSTGLNLYTGEKKGETKKQFASLKQNPVQVRSILPFKSFELKEDLPLVEIPKIEVKEEGEKEPDEEKKDKKPEMEETKSEDIKKPVEEIGKEEEKGFYDRRQEMLAAIVDAETDEEKLDREMMLGRYYFNNELYAESLGVLEEIGKRRPGFNNIRFKSLLGTSHYMMGHFIEAAQIFEELSEKITIEEGLEEIQFLWWVSNNRIRPKSMQTSKTIPLTFTKNIGNFISEYPKKLQQKLGLLATAYYIKSEDFEKARSVINLILDDPASAFLKNSARYYEASLLEKEDFVDDALEIWKDLSGEVDDRFNRARSTFAMYKLLYTLDRVDKTETREKLDNLRIVWKGDDFELDLLKFLGGLYIFERDFVNGLRTWRELITQFPKTQEALLVARQMKKTFIDLFDKGVAYELEPFVSLTIYFEFRELTPVGETGDRIVRQLVDHFVEADLLENAAALLTHQVRFRSKGEARVRLAIKLADIHLTNKRPELTIKALDFIKDETIPEDLKDQYKYLRARALIQMGELHKTLQLLATDWSKTAQSLRLDIFLQQQNWFGIMNITEPRLAEVIDRGDPIKGGSMKDLLLLSIAYATQREHDKLISLQAEFIDKIEDQSGRQIFAFVTNDSGSVDYLNFDSTVQLEDIEEFVADYLFWPSREWASVIGALEPQIEEKGLSKKKNLTQDEVNQVIQLAIAYAMEINSSEDPDVTKKATKGLKKVQQEFSNIKIDERSLPIFLSLTQDPDLIPDGALKTPTLLKNIESFVNNYRSMLVGPESVL